MKLLVSSMLLLPLAMLASAATIDARAPAKVPTCKCVLDCGPDKVCVSVPGSKPCRNVCVKPEFCGGIAGFPCEGGDAFICVDDPRDDCDPTQGGSDCGGLCIPADA